MSLNCASEIDDYRKRFQVFDTKTEQGLCTYNTLKLTLPLEITNNGLALTQQKQINILSIGSHDGERDVEIIKIVNDHVQLENKNNPQHPIKMFNRAIEPDETALGHFKDAVSNLPQELGNAVISFDIDTPRTVQEYIKEYTDDSAIPFDIIHMIHCAAFLTDLNITLKHFYEKELRPKGIIILAMAHSNDLMSILHDKGYSGFPSSYNPYNRATEILEIVNKNSWKYTTYVKEHHFDVSEVFVENSVEGNLLLDFLAMKLHFRAQGKAEDVESVLKIIKDNSVNKDGKYFATLAQRFIFINKQ